MKSLQSSKASLDCYNVLHIKKKVLLLGTDHSNVCGMKPRLLVSLQKETDTNENSLISELSADSEPSSISGVAFWDACKLLKKGHFIILLQIKIYIYIHKYS